MAEVRVGGAFFTFSADTVHYRTAVNEIITKNAQLRRSFAGVGASAAQTNTVLARTVTSMRSSVIATIGYAAGVGVLNNVLRNSIGGFYDWNTALIDLEKTSGIAGAELEYLGRQLARIGTVGVDGARALGISRQSIFEIASEWARLGQNAPDAIVSLTRTAAALETATNLVGVDAVRSIARLQEVFGLTTNEADRLASAIVHIGNNVAADEATITDFLRKVAISAEATGGVTPQFALGLTARLVEVGEVPERSATVIQRLQQQILDLARSDETLFQSVLRAGGAAAERAEYITERLKVEGGRTRELNDEILTTLLRYASRLDVVEADATEGVASELLRLLSGGENNVRIQAVSGSLSGDFESLQENLALSNEGWEDGNRHVIEANKRAESYKDRLTVVRSEMLQLGTAIGRVAVPALTFLAESWKVAAVAATAYFGALTARGALAATRGVRGAYRFLTGVESQGSIQARKEAREEWTKTNQSIYKQRQELVRLQAVRKAGVLTLSNEKAARLQVNGLLQREAALKAQIAANERAIRRGPGTVSPFGGTVLTRESARLQRQATKLSNDLAKAQGRLVTAERNLVVARGQGKRARREVLAAQKQIANRTATVNNLRKKAAELSKLAAVNMTRQQRAIRNLTRAVNFLGGPLGVITIALTAGIAAWQAWGRRVDEAAEKSKALIQSVKDLRQQLAEGLDPADSPAQRTVRDLIRQIEARTADRDAALQRIIEAQQREASTAGFLRVPTPEELAENIGRGPAFSRLRRLNNEIDELREQLESLNDVVPPGLTGADLAGGADIIPPLERTTLRETIRQQTRDFFVGLREEINRQVRDIEIDEQAINFIPGTLREQAFREYTRRYLSFQDELDRINGLINDRIDEYNERLTEYNDLQDQLAGRGQVALSPTSAEGIEAVSLRDAARARLAAITDEVVKLGQAHIELNRHVDEGANDYDALVASIADLRARRLGVEFRYQPVFDPDLVRPELDAANELSRAMGRVREDVLQLESAREEAREPTDRAAAGLRAQNEVLADWRRELTEAERHLVELGRQGDIYGGKLESLRERLTAMASAGQDVSDSQRELLRSLTDQVNEIAEGEEETAAYIERLRSLGPEFKALAKLVKAATESLSDSPLTSFLEEVARTQQRLEELWVSGFVRMGDELANFVQTGEFNFKELADSIINDLLRILIRATIIAPLLIALNAATGGLLGFLSRGADAITTGAALSLNHDGGIAGHPSRLTPLRGRRNDEVFALLQKGEEVLTARDPRHRRNIGLQSMESINNWIRRLPKYHSGGVVGGGGSGGGGVTINLRNESGTPLRAVDNGERMSPQGMVREIILRDARRNGPITRGMRGAL